MIYSKKLKEAWSRSGLTLEQAAIQCGAKHKNTFYFWMHGTAPQPRFRGLVREFIDKYEQKIS